jgi:tetratricopeptide (TPR) repeat protein
MSKKPARKKKTNPQDDMFVPDDLPVIPPGFNMEKMLSDLGRMIQDEGLETEEDVDAFLKAIMASERPLPTRQPETPLEKAQALMYEAWGTENQRKRVRLARKALALSPDCADAYILLGDETTDSVEEALEFYEKAVAAGERAMGPDAFEKYAEHFWGVIETRPYMRARERLAHCLLALEEEEEALSHMWALLELNPGDNQGIRYALLPFLLDKGLLKEAGQLLADYEDDASTLFSYTYPLILFARQGPGRAVNERLQEAIEYSPLPAAYLTGRRQVVNDMGDGEHPNLIGDEADAISYFLLGVHWWLRQKGAIEWLREQAQDFLE